MDKCATPDPMHNTSFNGKYLSSFRLTSIEEIYELLRRSNFKRSTVDPLPATIAKENMDILKPIGCDLVNLSLRTGNIDGAKTAHLTPLLKDDCVNHSELKNYKPISNLAFVGKLTE